MILLYMAHKPIKPAKLFTKTMTNSNHSVKEKKTVPKRLYCILYKVFSFCFLYVDYISITIFNIRNL